MMHDVSDLARFQFQGHTAPLFKVCDFALTQNTKRHNFWTNAPISIIFTEILECYVCLRLQVKLTTFLKGQGHIRSIAEKQKCRYIWKIWMPGILNLRR